MFPTVFDCQIVDLIPGSLHHQYPFKEIKLVNVGLTCFIKVKCLRTKMTLIICFEAPDDPSIKGLNERCKIGFKIFELNVLWFV